MLHLYHPIYKLSNLIILLICAPPSSTIFMTLHLEILALWPSCDIKVSISPSWASRFLSLKQNCSSVYILRHPHMIQNILYKATAWHYSLPRLISAHYSQCRYPRTLFSPQEQSTWSTVATSLFIDTVGIFADYFSVLRYCRQVLYWPSIFSLCFSTYSKL